MAKDVTAKPSKDKKVKVSLDDVEEINAEQKKKEDKRDTKFQEEMMYGKKAAQRTVRDTQTERDARFAHIRDMGGSHSIVMAWDFNERATRERVFMLRVGDKTAYISATEFQKYLRWV